MWLQYVIRWNKDLISKMKNITFQVHVNKKTSQCAHENAFKKTYEYQLHQWLMMTWILVRTKTTRKNTMCWPVAQFPNSICRNAKWMGLCLCSDINGRKQLKQKKGQQKLFWVEWEQWQRSQRAGAEQRTAPELLDRISCRVLSQYDL